MIFFKVREKSGKTENFQAQGKDRENRKIIGLGKSREKKKFLKSGKTEDFQGQGKPKILKVREKSGKTRSEKSQ